MHDPSDELVKCGSLDFEDLSFECAHMQKAAKPDWCFGEWTSFGDGVQLNFSDHSSPSPALTIPRRVRAESCHATEQQSACSQRQGAAWPDPQETMQGCFSAVDTQEGVVNSAVKPLEQLLEDTSPAHALVSSAALLWNRLVLHPYSPQLSVPSLCLHSRRNLLSALTILPAAAQTGTPPDMGPEENNEGAAGPHTTTLIQTKLQPPPQCQNTPGFLYQIPHRWLPLHNLRRRNKLFS